MYCFVVVVVVVVCIIDLNDKTSGNILLIILILLIIFATILIISFILTLCVIKRICVTKKPSEDHNQQQTYEEITQCHRDIPMEENAAYGHITPSCN